MQLESALMAWACLQVSGTKIRARVGDIRIFGWVRLTTEASNYFEVDLDEPDPQTELNFNNTPHLHTSLVSLQVGLILISKIRFRVYYF